MKTNKAIQTLINQQAHKLSLLYYITVRDRLRQRLEQLTATGVINEAEIRKEINQFTN